MQQMNLVKKETKTFQNLKEAELEMRKSMPFTLYKYRDWSIENHRDLLMGPCVWFSHPKSLNDPYDIRVPEIVTYGDINSEQFFNKVKEAVSFYHPELKTGSRDYEIACSNLLDLIKKDPKGWFEQNQKVIREGSLFDSIGVLSLSINELSEPLWAYYGNNGKGFCIGYDPVEIFKAHPCSFSIVTYDDEPSERNLLEPVEEFDSFWNFFKKRRRWVNEEEYRFVTLSIKSNHDRKVQIPVDAIREVILGSKVDKLHKEEIIEVLKNKFNSKVPLYILEEKLSSFGFGKTLIKY